MRISDWSSYVCSADLEPRDRPRRRDRRARQYLERHLGDREQPAPATRRELGQIVAGDILDDLRPRDKHLATPGDRAQAEQRSEEHTSELQSLMRTSYAVFCLNKKKK